MGCIRDRTILDEVHSIMHDRNQMIMHDRFPFVHDRTLIMHDQNKCHHIALSVRPISIGTTCSDGTLSASQFAFNEVFSCTLLYFDGLIR